MNEDESSLLGEMFSDELTEFAQIPLYFLVKGDDCSCSQIWSGGRIFFSSSLLASASENLGIRGIEFSFLTSGFVFSGSKPCVPLEVPWFAQLSGWLFLPSEIPDNLDLELRRKSAFLRKSFSLVFMFKFMLVCGFGAKNIVSSVCVSWKKSK